jgi:hypothetical protein
METFFVKQHPSRRVSAAREYALEKRAARLWGQARYKSTVLYEWMSQTGVIGRGIC